MLAVIADDITGAAEMAGIAYRYGLSCQLSIGVPSSITDTDILVIATDSRSYPAREAYDITAGVTRQLYVLSGEGVQVFRKTDSALRGNVEEELQAIIDNSPYTTAVFMPANPSKGRIIKDGIYYIRTADDAVNGNLGTPLSETDFRFDPEFPATTSSVRERFPRLTIPDATCQEDIDKIVEEVMASPSLTGRDRESIFLAGAADLFSSLICHLYNIAAPESEPFHGLSTDSTKLIVRGSTQSKAIDLGIPVEVMPLDVFYEESAPCTWAASILNRMKSHTNDSLPLREGWGGSRIITIGDKEVRSGKHAAVYLRQAMAEVTCAILAAHTPDELVIEGGATAFAILSQTPWQSFRITDEIAPGVVRMQPIPVMGQMENGEWRMENMQANTQPLSPNTQQLTHITLKPGSYAWGKLFANA